MIKLGLLFLMRHGLTFRCIESFLSDCHVGCDGVGPTYLVGRLQVSSTCTPVCGRRDPSALHREFFFSYSHMRNEQAEPRKPFPCHHAKTAYSTNNTGIATIP
jgi:hypothetical protein